MKIDNLLSQWARRKTVRVGAGAAALIAILTAVGAARSAPKNGFGAGDPLSAQKINDNFGDLDQRVAAVTAKVVRSNGASQISVGGVFVGKTAPTDGRFIDPTTNAPNGFRAAKRLCEATARSATAHMCDATEMVRSDQLGLFAAPLVGNDESMWVAKAAVSPPAGGNLRDCLSFSLNNTGEYAGYCVVNEKQGVPVSGTMQCGAGQCSQLIPIACCD